MFHLNVPIFLSIKIEEKHLVNFYESDQGLNRLASKLTDDAHINPGPFQKMKVRYTYTSQIFNATV